MQRKLRKAQKLELSSSRASSMEVIDVDDTGHDDDEAVDEGEDEPGHEPSGEDGKSGTRKPGKRQRRPKESRSLDKDMYKIFDGSALMALGNVDVRFLSYTGIDSLHRNASARACCWSARAQCSGRVG